MKRIISIVIALIFVCSIVGCKRQENAKNRIFNLVEKNYDAIVTACEKKDAAALLKINGIAEVDIVDGYVLVYCMGAGIAPSSQEYGFYFTEENRPVGVFDGYIACNTEDLVPDGNGYMYYDSGYNAFYTEHIKGNIYFYSNSF